MTNCLIVFWGEKETSLYITRSSSRYAALLLGPCGAGTLASRARWPLISQTVIVSDPLQVSQICDGKSPLSQPALIVSDPVQVSQICDGKSPLSQPALIVSNPVQISQICDGKSPPPALDRIRHDQSFPNL